MAFECSSDPESATCKEFKALPDTRFSRGLQEMEQEEERNLSGTTHPDPLPPEAAV